jgi:hypothetical protein
MVLQLASYPRLTFQALIPAHISISAQVIVEPYLEVFVRAHSVDLSVELSLQHRTHSPDEVVQPFP